MRPLLHVLLTLAAFPAVLAASAWLRGSPYEEPFTAGEVTTPPAIRVGLGRALDVPTLRLRVDGPVRVLDAPGLDVLWEGPGLEADAAPAPAPGPGLRLGDRLAFRHDEILLVPARPGALRVGNVRYRGSLRLVVRGPKRLLAAVNELDLEHYLWGVIGSEMRADWPLEALQAQAVAARTYALYEIRAGLGRAARGFDVFDDDRSQMYLGMTNETGDTILAGRATFGEICTWQGKPFKAFYQNTCGGRTEPARIVFEEQAVPPLEGRDCAWCDRSRHFRWRVEVPRLELAEKLFGSRKFGPVPAVRILERTPGGLVLKVGAVSPLKGNAVVTWTGKQFRSLVDPRKFQSLAFDVREERDRFVFEGRGWGHRVGLCQEGARGMAERAPDADYRKILEFYYPGAKVERGY